MPFSLTVDQQAVVALARRVMEEEDGRALKRELSASLRRAVEPIKARAMSNARALHSVVGGEGGSLRQALAGHIQVQGRLAGKSAGARVRVKTSGMPRGFATAARRLNRKSGWRHPVFGNTAVWVKQVAQPIEWFDRATRDSSLHREAEQACTEAIRAMALRIAGR